MYQANALQLKNCISAIFSKQTKEILIWVQCINKMNFV